MHKQGYINMIEHASRLLDIKIEHFCNNWGMKLSKGNQFNYIVGTTFPLNNAVCNKITDNKNLCSDVLTLHGIPNVPHHIILSTEILRSRNIERGNFEEMRAIINNYGFPLVVKRNNSSKGIGVNLVKNRTEFEAAVEKILSIDDTLCISPFRNKCREFRSIILNDRCLFTYEKIIPIIVGDGYSTVFEKIINEVDGDVNEFSTDQLFHPSLIRKLGLILELGEELPLQWAHNRFFGTKYKITINKSIDDLAISAAKAIDAKFVTVDTLLTDKKNIEILEINGSVGIHYPLIEAFGDAKVDIRLTVFTDALKELFK